MSSQVEQIAPGVERFALRTPTLPPASTTNTLVVGDETLVVIEPACPYEDEQEILEAYLDRRLAPGARIAAILLSHHHRDHVGHASRLCTRMGVPLMAHEETAHRIETPVDQFLSDNDVVPLDGDRCVTAYWTPGHAPGHLIFVDSMTRVAYVGDMVAGEGTILIEPSDGGDMGAYLASLERMRDTLCAAGTALVPSHGRPLFDAPAACQHLIDHRLRREQKVLAALGDEVLEPAELLARVYCDTPRTLWPLAQRSLEAHLLKLIREALVERCNDGRLRQAKPI